MLLGLVALLLIVGALVLAFSGFDTFQSGIGVEALREIIAPIPPYPTSRLLYQGDQTASGRCGETSYFEVYVAGGAVETAQAHYDRHFRQRGWIVNRGGYYPAESRRVDFVTPLPASISGVTLPPGVINAARAPGAAAFALVVAGWNGETCPQRNLSAG